jgi:hypothetical protein
MEIQEQPLNMRGTRTLDSICRNSFSTETCESGMTVKRHLGSSRGI